MLNSDEIGKGSDKDSDKSFSYLMTAQYSQDEKVFSSELFLENCTLNIR